MLNALNNRHYVAALTGIPSERQLTPVESRLDEALDGLSQVPFDLVLVARPLPGGQVTRWRQTLLELGSMVETLANTQVTETSSQAYSASLQEAFQRTLSEGTSPTRRAMRFGTRSVWRRTSMRGSAIRRR